jgi:hypothetical protein
MRTCKVLALAAALGLSITGSVLGQATLGKPVAAPQAALVPAHHQHPTAAGHGCAPAPCAHDCNGHRGDCDIVWLRPWTCEDLKCKPFEPICGATWLWCPRKCDHDHGCNGHHHHGNVQAAPAGPGEKKDGKGVPAGTVEVRANGNGEAEEPETLTPLMGLIECYNPSLFRRMECNGTKIYGWIQAGFTANFDSPDDRLNFGTNFNNRSNDVLLNQAYLVLERPLDLEKRRDEVHLGFRLDTLYGHDAPYFENPGLGFLDNYTGDSLEASRLTEMGLGVPQFYADLHTPWLTERGVDFRVGRFFTHMTWELSPATSTYFYSHSYEYFYGMPFTHIGGTATVHLGDTVDFMNGLVRGWDVVFDDTNDNWSYIGSVIWNSCDKRGSFAVAWTTGPEQIDNNDNNRTIITAYYTRKFGCRNQWMFVTGGGLGWEENAATLTGVQDAEWYSYSNYLFYTVDPRLTLGVRGEYFRDDDGTRTVFANSDRGGATWNRPGYAESFWGVTLGATWKPYQNLRLRPEIRFDWSNGSRPFNDQADNFQTTAAIDLIWEF